MMVTPYVDSGTLRNAPNMRNKKNVRVLTKWYPNNCVVVKSPCVSLRVNSLRVKSLHVNSLRVKSPRVNSLRVKGLRVKGLRA